MVRESDKKYINRVSSEAKVINKLLATRHEEQIHKIALFSLENYKKCGDLYTIIRICLLRTALHLSEK